MKVIIKFSVIAILMMIITGVYYVSVYDDVSDSVLRLHVISNSNSEKDIEIKTMVRDEILAEVGEKININSKKEEILRLLPDVEKGVNEFLKSIGAGYGAKIKVENAEIPRKEYNGIVLPKGCYEAIRVVLGDGAGENWWCVAYPPLCFTEEACGEISEEGKEILKNSMDYKSYNIITSDIKYELKIIEVAKNVISKLKK